MKCLPSPLVLHGRFRSGWGSRCSCRDDRRRRRHGGCGTRERLNLAGLTEVNVFRSLDAGDALRVGIQTYLLAGAGGAGYSLAVAFRPLGSARRRGGLCSVVIAITPPAAASARDGAGRNTRHSGDCALFHLVVVLAVFTLVQRVLFACQLAACLRSALCNLHG